MDDPRHPLEKDNSEIEAARHRLRLRAESGDKEAILAVLHHARAFACILSGVAFHGTEEAKEAVCEIAADEVIWPAITSRHGRIAGNAKNIEIYLDRIALGANRNLNCEAVDPRTHERLAGVMLLLDTIRRRGCEPRRDGMGRDAWLSSEGTGHGKQVIRAIKAELPLFYDRERLVLHSFVAPLVTQAEDEARRMASAKGLATVSEAAITRHLALDAAKIIHGMLAE